MPKRQLFKVAQSPAVREAAVDAIARDVLGLETLETRNCDRLDFVELSRASIAAALARAYEAGRRAR